MDYWSIELNIHLSKYTYTEQELCEMGAKVISATVVEDEFYRRFGDRGFMYDYPPDPEPEINSKKPIECYRYRLDPEFIKGGVFLNEVVYKFLYYGAINYIRDGKIDQLI